MGSRSPDRTLRLATLKNTPRGYVRMAVCLNCQHMAPLPVRDLVRRYGDLFPAEMALLRLRCEECQQSKVEPSWCRFASPGAGSGGRHAAQSWQRLAGWRGRNWAASRRLTGDDQT
jgi:hypothetical protein